MTKGREQIRKSWEKRERGEVKKEGLSKRRDGVEGGKPNKMNRAALRERKQQERK